MPKPDPNIIEKVQKLLRLADEEGGGTEGERGTAMLKATELMAKHNIERYHLTQQTAPGEVGSDDSLAFKGSANEWMSKLAFWVGDASYCSGWITTVERRKAWRVTLVGRADNVAFTKLLLDYLIPWLQEECKIGLAEERRRFSGEGPLYGDRFNPNAYKRAFYRAASARITQRLRQQRNELAVSAADGNEKEGLSTATDLVLNERAANDQWINDHGPKDLRTMRATALRSVSGIGGVAAGTDAGNRADLSPGRKLGRR